MVPALGMDERQYKCKPRGPRSFLRKQHLQFAQEHITNVRTGTLLCVTLTICGRSQTISPDFIGWNCRLVFPTNATGVERVFSAMAWLKNKRTNRILDDLLNARMHVKLNDTDIDYSLL